MKAALTKSVLAIVFCVVTGVAVLVMGQACGELRSSEGQGGGSSSSLASSAGSTGAPEMKIIPGTRTASTVYANQVLENLVSCSGIEMTSTRIREVWGQRKGSLSEDGKAVSVTGPMLISMASISAEICRELIAKEAATNMSDRRIFTEVNLAPGAAAQDRNGFSNSLSRLTKACWQRTPTAEESTTILDPLSAVTDDPAGRMIASANETNRARALFMCTAVLASLKSIEI
jgi:hypothetical protein